MSARNETESDKPLVLLIDDREDKFFCDELNRIGQVTCRYFHPRDLELEALDKPTLILIDYDLTEDWSENQGLSFSNTVPDGLALSSILRRALAKEHDDTWPPIALALYTGKLAELSSPIPASNQEHLLARLHNLEWIFRKEEENVEARVASLATAVAQLPINWPNDPPDAGLVELGELLGIEKTMPGCDQLLEDALNCTPPIHYLSEWSHGLAVIRWVAQRILPYPCFLLDTHYLSARFRVQHSWLKEMLKDSSPLRQKLSSGEYKGILKDFDGPRWWSSVIEKLLRDATGGNSMHEEMIHKWLGEVAGNRIDRLEFDEYAVVCMTSGYEGLAYLHEPVPLSESVRIQPDDWPPYALDAWVRIRDVKDDQSIRVLVRSEDLGKLEE